MKVIRYICDQCGKETGSPDDKWLRVDASVSSVRERNILVYVANVDLCGKCMDNLAEALPNLHSPSSRNL